MYKRLELHNHTTESDAGITCQELIEYMVSDQVDAFAITDHNTISGHPKIRKLLEEGNYPIQCIYGMEYTTYYGHILCLNLNEYVPWRTINRHKPELLFQAAKEKGALAGIAHPFSFGEPFARGCHFDMEVTDFHSFDFMEIFNDLEPLCEVNKPALLWWEDLVLDGYPIAMTCGMDLHGRWDMKNQYATFIQAEEGGDIALQLEQAIRTQSTIVSKGPVLKTSIESDAKTLQVTIVPTGKPGFTHCEEDPYLLTIRTKDGTKEWTFPEDGTLTLSLGELPSGEILIPKLFQKDTSLENLVCVSPAIHLR